MPEAIRVGVVDIYPIFRDAVVRALRGSRAFHVIGEGVSAADAESLAPKCDVLLIEGAVPGSIPAVRRILQYVPATKIVFLSAEQDDEHAGQALHEGVHGYLMKQITGSDLIRALTVVHAGARQITSDLAWRLITQSKAVVPRTLDRITALSTREQQVLGHTLKGLTNLEMAKLLGMSISSVKRYKTRMFRQMGVRNRVQAIINFADAKSTRLT